MEKIVSNGDRDCTIVLDGTECSVEFDRCFLAYSVQNNSTSDVFVSIHQGANAGDDGVVRIKAGSSGVYAHMRTEVKTVYFNGTGEIQVHGQNDTNNSFRNAPVSGGGGTTVDSYSKTESDARYAQKAEIPTELPANGGNADTADAINGLVILNSENIALGTVEGCKKWVCMANTVPNSAGYVTAGIWFKNNLSYSITAQIIAYAAKKAPTIQAGYGTGTMKDMLEKGLGREWFANTTLETTATPVSMIVPPGKTGYFGFNRTTEGQEAYINDVKAYTIKDVRLM